MCTVTSQYPSWDDLKCLPGCKTLTTNQPIRPSTDFLQYALILFTNWNTKLLPSWPDIPHMTQYPDNGQTRPYPNNTKRLGHDKFKLCKSLASSTGIRTYDLPHMNPALYWLYHSAQSFTNGMNHNRELWKKVPNGRFTCQQNKHALQRRKIVLVTAVNDNHNRMLL